MVIVAAVDARLAGETGEGRVQGPSAFVAPEAIAVPCLVDGHQVVSIGDLETAAGADGRLLLDRFTSAAGRLLTDVDRFLVIGNAALLFHLAAAAVKRRHLIGVVLLDHFDRFVGVDVVVVVVLTAGQVVGHRPDSQGRLFRMIRLLFQSNQMKIN